ncbi:MAG: RNA polymerase sigma factor [Gemmatimonadetes bacterium]|nr:RNA polymerase sigma factor [Gemmatimonadota bacterium]
MARLSAWIGEFAPKLLPVARTLCVSPDEGEDLLQEVWMVALRQKEVPDGDDVGPWLHRILFNVARTRERTAARRRRLMSRWSPSGGMDSVQESPATLEAEQLRWLLRSEIAALPELQARVVLLRVVGGLSTAETAQAIHRAEGTVKVCLHRGLMRLEQRLKADGVDFAVPGQSAVR